MCIYICVQGFVMELQRVKIPCVKNITVDPFKLLFYYCNYNLENYCNCWLIIFLALGPVLYRLALSETLFSVHAFTYT